MKRSQINTIIRNAIVFFNDHHFRLPRWAYYSITEWEKGFDDAQEIFDLELGWDVTDFGLDDFSKNGLVLFTLRNGKPGTEYKKPYAEKIMVSQPGQVTPLHFHWKKWEDIINRGGGDLLFKLYRSDEKENLGSDPITVSIDGMQKKVEPGSELILKAGESLLLEPFIYHEFFARNEPVMIGEVSMVNDDNTDNRFYNAVGRFPEIEEDTDPEFLLCNDYAKFLF